MRSTAPRKKVTTCARGGLRPRASGLRKSFRIRARGLRSEARGLDTKLWRAVLREALWCPSSVSYGRSTALAAGVVVSLLAAGCMTPIGVKRISPQEANRALTANELTTGKPGAPTREFLYRLNLTEKYREDPAATIAALHSGLGQADESNRLFAPHSLRAPQRAMRGGPTKLLGGSLAFGSFLTSTLSTRASTTR
jgi:hypothetical protein